MHATSKELNSCNATEPTLPTKSSIWSIWKSMTEFPDPGTESSPDANRSSQSPCPWLLRGSFCSYWPVTELTLPSKLPNLKNLISFLLGLFSSLLFSSKNQQSSTSPWGLLHQPHLPPVPNTETWREPPFSYQCSWPIPHSLLKITHGHHRAFVDQNYLAFSIPNTNLQQYNPFFKKSHQTYHWKPRLPHLKSQGWAQKHAL